jgi:hypothetical protein
VKILVQLGGGGMNGVVSASSELCTTVFVDGVEEVVVEAIVRLYGVVWGKDAKVYIYMVG